MQDFAGPSTVFQEFPSPAHFFEKACSRHGGWRTYRRVFCVHFFQKIQWFIPQPGPETCRQDQPWLDCFMCGCIRVNLITTSRRDQTLQSWLVRATIPEKPYFRLVNAYDLPIYIYISLSLSHTLIYIYTYSAAFCQNGMPRKTWCVSSYFCLCPIRFAGILGIPNFSDTFTLDNHNEFPTNHWVLTHTNSHWIVVYKQDNLNILVNHY